MNLDHDVLAVIMKDLKTRQTLLPLMKTCRTLYQTGLPYLLGLPLIFSVQPSHRKFNEDFRRYIRSHPSYTEYIKVVSIYTYIEDECIFDLLSLILKDACRLESLGVNLDIKKETRAKLLAPHSSISSLRYLSLENVDEPERNMLKTFNAPLDGLLLTFAATIHDDNLLNPIPLLHNFSKSLRFLMTSFASWTYQESGETTILPNVRILNIIDCGVPNSTTIIRAFPNLSHLAIVEESLDIDVEELARLRSSNVEGSSGLRPWSILEEVRAKDISLLYALGLTCKVNRMVLEYCPSSNSQMKEAQVVLSDMRPTILNISFFSEAFLGVPAEYMAHMFAYGELTHLSLKLYFDESENGDDMDTGILRAIETIRRATKLEYLNLAIRWSRPCRPSANLRNILREAARIRRAEAGEDVEGDSDSDDAIPPDPMGEHVDDMDHRVIASQIFDALESLQVVVLNFQPVEQKMKMLTRGWRVMKGASSLKEGVAYEVNDIAGPKEISVEECRGLDESYGHDDDDFYFRLGVC
ncbi:hypothetical protein C8Q75DRAFT_764776 [Abortiporus biennis]|nr:hypothetical protein C8Q75DRAFT_764776 [Abortiporus biennis]